MTQSMVRSEVPLGVPYFGMNTPRACFTRATREVLKDLPEGTWNPQREMLGWELGERRDLLPENEDVDMDKEMGPADH